MAALCPRFEIEILLTSNFRKAFEIKFRKDVSPGEYPIREAPARLGQLKIAQTLGKPSQHLPDIWGWDKNPLVPGGGTGREKTRFPFWYNFLTKWLLVFILVFGTGLNFELYVFLTTGLMAQPQVDVQIFAFHDIVAMGSPHIHIPLP